MFYVTYHSLTVFSLKFLLSNHLLDIIVLHVLLLLLEGNDLTVFDRFFLEALSFPNLLVHLLSILLMYSLSGSFLHRIILIKPFFLFHFSLAA